MNLPMDDGRHILRTPHDVFGVGTFEILQHSPPKERQPVIEEFTIHSCRGNPLRVRADQIASERIGPEQYGIPEVVQLGEVNRPINLRNLIKDKSEPIVLADLLIEPINEDNNVGPAVDIGERGGGRGSHGSGKRRAARGD